ncbi:SDR family NAD(P)-dependent oxidoreductase [Zhouia sp. PK063]|uniref:SDR family NAD(P)-dependent oxidoreductase n=1 Tax=Zhouia sp. PK063 TaxID=3373602 RepID=UPI0037A0D710
MDLNIKNKIALITGADSGIGFETAKILAGEGARVIISDMDEKKLDQALTKLEKYATNEIIGIQADLTKPEEIEALHQQIKITEGTVDMLINCAGARGAAGSFLELTDDDWMKTIEVDLMAAVRLTRKFIPDMQESGWGRIVLISSENAFQPYVEESPYNACKAAIINLAKCLSRAYGKDGVLVNTVSPAYIETPMTDAMMDELAKERNCSVEEAVEWFLENKRPHIEVERRGQPKEVANVISFLCSDLSSYVNGSNYRVDGGSVASAFG